MTVRYRARALQDIDGIYDWLARHSTNVAEKVEAALMATAEWLGEHPELGTMTDADNVRRWPMPEFRYTIFYLIDRNDDALDVLRVMDGRRVRNLKRLPK